MIGSEFQTRSVLATYFREHASKSHIILCSVRPNLRLTRVFSIRIPFATSRQTYSCPIEDTKFLVMCFVLQKTIRQYVPDNVTFKPLGLDNQKAKDYALHTKLLRQWRNCVKHTSWLTDSHETQNFLNIFKRACHGFALIHSKNLHDTHFKTHFNIFCRLC